MLEGRLGDLVGEVLLLLDIVDEDGEVEHDPESEGMGDGQVALGQGLSFLVGRLGQCGQTRRDRWTPRAARQSLNYRDLCAPCAGFFKEIANLYC